MATPNVTQVLALQKPDPDHAIRVAHAVIYPEDTWFCIAAFIASISLCRVVSLFVRTLSIHQQRSQKSTPARGVIVLSRLPLAAANDFRAIVFRSTIQLGTSYTLNIAEVFVTAVYITLIFVWALVNSTNTKGEKYDPKYWANIAANIATTQLPLIAALGTRNNIISYLTGISYETLQYLHRTFARVVCILIWVHAGGRVKIGLVRTLSLRFSWVRCGLLAATAFTILSLMSIRPLRRRHFEVFLALHFVMVLIVLLGGYFHAREKAEGNHIWPAFLIWGLDRTLRGIRILIYNIGYFKKGSLEHYGHFEVLSPHFVRLTVRRPTYMHWRPGQNVYLTVPSVSGVCLEAHPFTISTIDAPLDVAGGKGNGENPIGTESVGEPDTDYKALTFLIRVRSGFTKRLFRDFGQTPEMKVILDGPYGSPPRLRAFDTVVLIAGGSGVSFTLPLFLDVVLRAKQGSTDCQKIIFIWVIRDASDIRLISDTLLPVITNPPSGIVIDIRIHVTASNNEKDKLNNLEDGDEENKTGYTIPEGINLPSIDIAAGRPDLTRVVREEIAKAIGAISFNVCGTPTMSNIVRSALCQSRFLDILRGGASTALHVESFGNT